MSRPRPIPTARGFTLIETMFATLLGTGVILSCLAIFAAMDRTDSAAARRHHETDQMSRLHVVMERTFSQMVITDSNAASPNVGGRSTAQPMLEKDAAHNGQAQLEPRPRVMLSADTSAGLKDTLRNAGLGGGSAPQRLELVTSRSPVPAGYGRMDTQLIQAAIDAQAGLTVRGVFEMRPDSATPASRLEPGEKPDPESMGWTLWWRPLPANLGMQTPDPYTLDTFQDPLSVRIATNLAECSWEAFKTVMDPVTQKPKGREKLKEFEATQIQDLPAYVEMHITTASGLSAQWMFEVGWSFGPETSDEAAQTGEDANGDAGGDSVSIRGGTTTPNRPGANGRGQQGTGQPGRGQRQRGQGGGRGTGGRGAGGGGKDG